MVVPSKSTSFKRALISVGSWHGIARIERNSFSKRTIDVEEDDCVDMVGPSPTPVMDSVVEPATDPARVARALEDKGVPAVARCDHASRDALDVDSGLGTFGPGVHNAGFTDTSA